MMTRHRFLLPLLIAVSLPQTVSAQINPFRGRSTVPLNAADISALTDATNRLLDQPQLVAGSKETWNSPSGASGTVTAGDAVRRQGMACRVMNYTIVPGSPGAERNRTLTWCKTKDGWKIG
jgi:surface antigen